MKVIPIEVAVSMRVRVEASRRGDAERLLQQVSRECLDKLREATLPLPEITVLDHSSIINFGRELELKGKVKS